MKNFKSFNQVLFITLGFVLVSASGVKAETSTFSTTFVGTSQSHGIDSDGDGQAGSHFEFAETSSLGEKFETRGMDETVAFDGVSFCGPTSVELQYLSNALVTTYEDGSQVYSRMTAGTLCFNTDDGSVTFDLEFDIVGGTGRFEGASGSREVSGTGQQVNADVSAWSAEPSGTITTPDTATTMTEPAKGVSR